MTDFVYKLPDVGEGLDQAEIMSWKVSVGDAVVPDQVLAEVETDKSMVEVPSPVAGVVTKLAGSPGDFIEVGATFVEIALDDGANVPAGEDSTTPFGAEDSPAPIAAPRSGAAPESGTSSDEGAGREPRGAHRILASPATRRFAHDSGVDLNDVAGSGPAGRITKTDVDKFLTGGKTSKQGQAAGPGTIAGESGSVTEASAGTGSSAPPAGRSVAAGPLAEPKRTEPIHADKSVPFRGLRRTIAKNMVESWQTIPHITDFREIDATGLVEARATLNTQLQTIGRNEKVTFLPFLIRAVAIALRHRKEFNSTLDLENETITYLGQRNIGLAVSTPAGLFVPVIQDADSKMLLDLARESQELAQSARDRTITSAQMSRGTFTITNFGSYGGWLGTPIIRPPEVAIAGFGKIVDKVVAVDGRPEVRKVLPIAVSADHQVIDGADMGAFLQLLTQLLENPTLLMAGDF